MVQSKLFNLNLARTTGILSGASRVAMMLLTTLLLTMTAQTARAWEGSGTEASPYLIKTTGDLNDLSTQSQTNNFDGVYFQLYNDITFDNTQSNNFVPIASSSYHFQGIFDGNGKTIGGVRISSNEQQFMALFSRLGENGVVKNLKVADTRIEAYNLSGILTGYCVGTVKDCSIGSDVVLHAIRPNGSQYGSIAGHVREGHISHCSSAASITLSSAGGGYNCMGGLVGENAGTVENSLFTGSLQKSTLTGPSCYNNYAVVGKLNDGTISNCYYTNGTLENPFSGVSRAYVATLPTQFSVDGSQGVTFDGKFYTGQGKTITFVSSSHPLSVVTWCVFDVKKTSDNSNVATDVEHSYVIPAYDITLVYKGILPFHETTSPYNYYNISKKESWDILADYVAEGWDTSGKTFSLNEDVTVTKRVGTSEHPFKGTFTGNYYNQATPNKLTFNATATGDYCAPFAYISGATIKDLQVAGTVSTAYTKASGLVGKVSGTSTIQNILSTVTVSSTYSGAGYHGGLVGEVASGASLTMSNSIFGGSLQGSSTSAWSGLVGRNNGTLSMTECLFAPASVSVNTSNCYSLVNSSANTLTNCYYATALGTTQGTRAYTATLAQAIVPTDASAGIFFNSKLCIVPTQTAILKYLANEGDEGVTVSAMTAKDESNQNVTVTKNGDTYSITMPAKNITVTGVMTDIWGLAGGADGSEEHPYIITTTAGLNHLAERVNGSGDYDNYEGKYFKLGDNIRYTHDSGDTWDKADGTTVNFTPIGGYVDGNDHCFSGHFDGANFTISGIRIYSTDNYYVGLFGLLSTNNAEIKNVILDDARIIATKASSDAGGILGNSGPGGATPHITNCHVKNTLVKGVLTAGGIVGDNLDGTISDCTSGATVIATADNGGAGGIAGENYGTLENCFYYGSSVTSSSSNATWAYAGAICNNGGTIRNNYYLPCTVTTGSGTYTTNNGVCTTSNIPTDVSDNDGALPVYALTLAAVTNGTIAAATKTITHNSTDYYKADATVTVTATPNEGYSVGSVTYNDGSNHAVEPVSDVYSFTMPATAVTVSAAFSENAFCLAYDSNNDAVLTTWNGKTAKVTLADRTLKKDGSWNTLCLPFDVTIASSPLAGDGVTAKVFSSSSNLTNGALRLDFINAPATILAGTPFIVKWTSGDDISNPVFTGVEVNSTAPVAVVSTDGNVTFAGSFSPFDPTTGLWFDANNTTNGSCHVALSTAEPFREGYTLTGGWNTQPDGSGVDVTTIPFDVVVYAKGTENAPASIALTIGASGWATYYHNYTASYSAGSGTEVYYVSGVTPTTVTLTTTNGMVPAALPVLIYHADGGEVTLTKEDGSDGTIPAGITADTQFHGTATALASIPGFTAGSTYALYGGKFLLVDTDAGIAAHKCWLTLSTPNAARQLSIVINDETSGITTTNYTNFTNSNKWYAIDGRKLDGKPTKKGLYINNGKKTVIK